MPNADAAATQVWGCWAGSCAVLHVLPDRADEAIDVFHRVVEVRRGAKSRIRSIRRTRRHDDLLVLRQRLTERPRIEIAWFEDHDRGRAIGRRIGPELDAVQPLKARHQMGGQGPRTLFDRRAPDSALELERVDDR